MHAGSLHRVEITMLLPLLSRDYIKAIEDLSHVSIEWWLGSGKTIATEYEIDNITFKKLSAPLVKEVGEPGMVKPIS